MDLNNFKLRLVSDFNNFYDAWFDLEGPALYRLTNSGLDKRNQFKFMESIGLKCPRHGLVKDMDFLSLDDSVVAYWDEMAHAGDGKEKYTYSHALKYYPNLYCSEFVQGHPGCSERYLFIGNRCFRYSYRSEDWRSNVDSTISEPDEVFGYELRKTFNNPLCAFDFVGWLAIDFNIAPGLNGFGLEKLISGLEVVKELKKFIYERLICPQ